MERLEEKRKDEGNDDHYHLCSRSVVVTWPPTTTTDATSTTHPTAPSNSIGAAQCRQQDGIVVLKCCEYDVVASVSALLSTRAMSRRRATCASLRWRGDSSHACVPICAQVFMHGASKSGAK